jgi:hypothetical protein
MTATFVAKRLKAVNFKHRQCITIEKAKGPQGC